MQESASASKKEGSFRKGNGTKLYYENWIRRNERTAFLGKGRQFFYLGIDPSHSLRMTINVFLTMTPCECIAICYWLAANSDWLSEFDKLTAYTEQLFLLWFCKDDRQGEGHKYRYCPLHNPDNTKRYTRRERYSRRAVINWYFAGNSVFDY